MRRWFDIAWKDDFKLFMAWVDRKVIRMAWIYANLFGLKNLDNRFNVFHDETALKASFNGQVMVLERMLNLHFYSLDVWHTNADPTASGHIYIEDSTSGLTVQFIYFDDENQADPDVWLDSEAQPGLDVWLDSEWNQAEDFVVKVPVALVYDSNEMEALIDARIIGGVRYTIQTY